MRVELLTTLQQLAELVPAWEQLAEHAEHGEWFAGPDWLLPWIHTFAAERELRCAAVFTDNTLVGFLPLLRAGNTTALCTPWAVTPTNSHVRRVGALAARSAAPVYQAVFAELTRRGEPLCLELRQLPEGGADDLALREVVQRDRLYEFARGETPGAIIDLSMGWEPYLASLSRDARRGRTRKAKKLDSLGGWRIRNLCDAGDIATAWPSLLHIEARSWKHPQGTSIANEPGVNSFYREVADRCAARGVLRLAMLEHKGTPVAHALSVSRGGVYYALKTSFDEGFRALSPGSVIMWHAIEQAAQEQCRTFDFLGDLMEWKSHLVTHTPAYVTRTVFDGRQLGCRLARFSERTLKPLGRALGLNRAARRVRGGGSPHTTAVASATPGAR